MIQRSFLPLTFLSLFSSLGTLLCCALPALLVSLGMGAAVAGLVSSIPQLIWLSEHKGVVFGVAGLMMLVSGGALYKSKDLPCPTDPKLRAACIKGRKLSVAVFFVGLLFYSVGLFFAFVAPQIGA
ncbi:MAG: hypothetical protein KF799_13900 [Bdellovibrionales bacterium]|nr:hypothetical protein [Bdellovibrionales bacterium]